MASWRWIIHNAIKFCQKAGLLITFIAVVFTLYTVIMTGWLSYRSRIKLCLFETESEIHFSVRKNYLESSCCKTALQLKVKVKVKNRLCAKFAILLSALFVFFDSDTSISAKSRKLKSANYSIAGKVRYSSTMPSLMKKTSKYPSPYWLWTFPPMR